MKAKIFTIVVFTLFGITAANAQMQRMSIEDRVKVTMEKLAPLQLDQEQQKNTTAAFANYYTRQQKTMQDARDRGQRPEMADFQKLTSERDATLKEIFTEEQFKKFKDEIEPSLRPQRRGREG